MKYLRPSRFRRAAKWDFLAECVILFCLWIVSPLSWSWIPVALFIALAIPTAVLWHRDRRTVSPGHRLHCGYNLTGADHAKCPECGTPITRRPR